MTTPDIPIDDILKRLHLANTRRVWRDLIQRAEKEHWSFHDFLGVLLAEEVAHRKTTRLKRVSSRARFPFLKTIDDFDFTFQSTVRLELLGSCLSADFVTEGRSLILYGKTGRGKTHLAIAIAYRAIQNGFDAVFATAAELIDDLSRASQEGRLREAVAFYAQPSVLVCDEVGYLAYGTDAANVLFHVVNARYLKKRAMIFTTNKPPKSWGRVLHDEDLAAAIVDRILHRGRLLTLDGPSARTKHHHGLDDLVAEPHEEVATFPGKQGAKFPEPTACAASSATVSGCHPLESTSSTQTSVPSEALQAASSRRKLLSATEALPTRCHSLRKARHELLRDGVFRGGAHMGAFLRAGGGRTLE